MDPRHPYEHLSLFTVGLILGLWLVGSHALMLAKPAKIQGLLTKFPRDTTSGQILLAIGLAWFWLLVAPEGLGKLSVLAMDLGEFNGAKPLLRILVPVSLVLVAMSVRDFLAVRALGVVGLMVASPMLESAFLKDPASRVLVPIYAYALLTASLCLGRHALLVPGRRHLGHRQPKTLDYLMSLAGLGYGVATLVCALGLLAGVLRPAARLRASARLPCGIPYTLSKPARPRCRHPPAAVVLLADFSMPSPAIRMSRPKADKRVAGTGEHG